MTLDNRQIMRIGEMVGQGYKTVRFVERNPMISEGILMRAEDGQQVIVHANGALTTSDSPHWPEELK
jgi:hypothetical protein